MSHFDLRRFKAIVPDFPSKILSYALTAFDYFLSYFNLIIYPPAISPPLSKLRESMQGMAVLTRREVDRGVRAPLTFPSKVDFFPFFRSWRKLSKEWFNPHSKHFETIEYHDD